MQLDAKGKRVLLWMRSGKLGLTRNRHCQLHCFLTTKIKLETKISQSPLAPSLVPKDLFLDKDRWNDCGDPDALLSAVNDAEKECHDRGKNGTF